MLEHGQRSCLPIPDRSQPEWVRNAKSKIVLQGTGEWLKAQLPDDPESTILKRLKRPKGDEQEAPDAPPDQRSDAGGRSGDNPGYERGDRAGMRQLIESKVTR